MTGKLLFARMGLILSLAVAVSLSSSCIKPKITLFPDGTEPLKEFTLQGSGKEKILVVPVKGFISDSEKGFPLHRRPSMVQEVVSQLNKAQKDKDIKAVILKIDSPGGTVTASDVLYHEIVKFKERSGARLTVMMMEIATSGGYYIALPADVIIAHPTSITGSIGVVFLRPDVSGLMDKMGIGVGVDKSGKNKDMGSPFRRATEEEKHIVQNLINDLAQRFLGLVVKHRRLSEAAKEDVSSARIYTANDALQLGLVDRIGYLDDAIQDTVKLAGLPEDAKVVVYRRTEYPNDNVYNTNVGSRPGTPEMNLVNLDLAEALPPFHTGFYYLWMPGFGN